MRIHLDLIALLRQTALFPARTMELADTELGRAKERQRRAYLSGAAAVLAKTISMCATLITIPLTLNYLGSERFGMWMTISSILAMLAFADFGIGNGLLNAISAANGRDDSAEIRAHISSAILMLSLIAGSILIVFSIVYPFISWGALFNVRSPRAVSEAGPTVFALILCFSLNVPATIVQRAQLGLQLGFMANIWQAIGSIMALFAIILSVRLHASLPILVIALMGTPLIASSLNGLIFFLRTRPDLAPHLFGGTWKSATSVARTGLLFLLLQIVASVTYSSDNLILAHFLGAASVTTYAVPEKLFSFITVMLAMLLTPLWPAYGEALARGDRTWVNNIFRKSILLSVSGATCCSVLLVLFGQFIINKWIGHPVSVPFQVILGLGIWKIIEAAGTAFGILLNGANVVAFQVKVALATGIAALALKIYLTKHIGLSGPIFSTIACYTVFALIPYSYFVRRILNSELPHATTSR